MNKADLKKLLKPLIKECIKEVIFEDGVLSGIVSEVAQGMGGTPLVETRKIPKPRVDEQRFTAIRQQSLTEQKQKVKQHKEKLLEAIGTEAYNGVNLFEGTAPLASAPSAPGTGAPPQSPLAGVAPTDSGVDITNLFGSVGNNWKAHMDSGK